MNLLGDFFLLASIVGVLVSQAQKGLVTAQQAGEFIVALAVGLGLYRWFGTGKPSGCFFLSAAITLLSVWTLLLGSTVLAAAEFWTLVVMAFGVYIMCGGGIAASRRHRR